MRTAKHNQLYIDILESTLTGHQAEAARRERDAAAETKRDMTRFQDFCRQMAYRNMVQTASRLAAVRTELKLLKRDM